MQTSTKQFLLGLGVGIAVGFLGLLAVAYVGTTLVVEDGEAGAFGLAVPDVPDRERSVAYGTLPPAWQVRRVAPDSMGGGQMTAMQALRGRAVLVNVWATWCAPCKAEMPSLQSLYDATSRDSLALVIVSEEAPEVVRDFVQREDYTMPIYHATEMPPVLRTNALPTTFVADAQGAIVWRHTGAADWNAPAVRRYLRDIAAVDLAAPTTPAAPPSDDA